MKKAMATITKFPNVVITDFNKWMVTASDIETKKPRPLDPIKKVKKLVSWDENIYIPKQK